MLEIRTHGHSGTRKDKAQTRLQLPRALRMPMHQTSRACAINAGFARLIRKCIKEISQVSGDARINSKCRDL